MGYNDSSETLEQDAQRSNRCSIPENTQGQAGWGSVQPGLVKLSWLIAGSLDQTTFHCHFQPNLLYHSIKHSEVINHPFPKEASIQKFCEMHLSQASTVGQAELPADKLVNTLFFLLESLFDFLIHSLIL